uniref:VASt domain-containing protein n=1 Tax=Timema genevievae TaxID=629358 RepID=A0A7R9K4Y8_TIMGE|nr:unnamed protein product [Timema genevievae]
MAYFLSASKLAVTEYAKSVNGGDKNKNEDNVSRSSDSGGPPALELSRSLSHESNKDRKESSRNSDRSKKKSSWYTALYPTYKSRSEDFRRIFKDVPPEERLVVDYSCALQKDILVHGRLYVSQNYLCFYANIFRWETLVSLKWKDVTAITKEKTALVIPNAVLVCTETDKLFFTSFGARDKTYLMLFRVWQNALMDQEFTESPLELPVECHLDDSLPGLLYRHQQVSPHSPGKRVPGISSINLISENLPSDMSDTTDSDADKHGDMNLSPWQQSPDSGLKQRVVTLTMPLSQSVGPKSTHVCETQSNPFSVYLENSATVSRGGNTRTTRFGGRLVQGATVAVDQTADDGEIWAQSQSGLLRIMLPCSKPGQLYAIDSDSVNSGIPYADSFYVTTHYCITRTGDNECCLAVYCQIKYKKNVWGIVKMLFVSILLVLFVSILLVLFVSILLVLFVSILLALFVSILLALFVSILLALLLGFIEKNTWSGLEDFHTSLTKALQVECDNGTGLGVKKKVRRRRRGLAGITPAEAARPIIGLVEGDGRTLSEMLSWGVMAILVFLVCLNALLYYKLWVLEEWTQNSSHSFTVMDLQVLRFSGSFLDRDGSTGYEVHSLTHRSTGSQAHSLTVMDLQVLRFSGTFLDSDVIYRFSGTFLDSDGSTGSQIYRFSGTFLDSDGSTGSQVHSLTDGVTGSQVHSLTDGVTGSQVHSLTVMELQVLRLSGTFLDRDGATGSQVHSLTEMELQVLRTPPKSQDEWLRLLQQQEALHNVEMQKWQKVLQAAVQLLRQTEESLSELQVSIHPLVSKKVLSVLKDTFAEEAAAAAIKVELPAEDVVMTETSREEL